MKILTTIIILASTLFANNYKKFEQSHFYSPIERAEPSIENNFYNEEHKYNNNRNRFNFDFIDYRKKKLQSDFKYLENFKKSMKSKKTNAK
ncbi:MAG: hypothetical protein HRT40_02140 [Campylobacteraceae bacterium]|nr:hypothetical protein [Campylobacteraceae bacterium]